MRGWIDQEARMARQRLLLLRQLPRMGPGLLTAGTVLLLLRGLAPAATALATTALIDTLISNVDGVDEITAPLALIVVLLAGQIVEHFIDPVRYAAIRRVDGAHRRAVAEAVCAPVGIANLESRDYQDDLRRATGDPDNWTESTPGAGAWSQLAILFRYLGVFLAAAVIARDAPWLAAALVLILVAYRTVQRREFLRPLRVWSSMMPHRRRAEYWASVLTQPTVAKELRVFGLSRWAGDRYLESATTHLGPFHDAKMTKLRRQWLWGLAVVIAMTASLYVLGTLAADGQIPIARLAGDLTAVGGMFIMISGGEEILHLEAGGFPLLALERIRERGRSVDRVGSGQPPGDIPLVRFESVDFGYPGATRPVLSGLDFEIRPGEVLALVGLNGVGKTTIIKLLARLYEPDSGRITVDGVDLGTLDPIAWRRRMCVVFQDFLRYELSARDNVLLGHPDTDSEPDLRAAAAEAGVAELVEGLPDGWATPLSPGRTGGVDLSGGQWQRMALARALYAMRAGARVLVLDEPTAHLDVRTEFDVFDRLARVARDASVVLISHRLSTVREADRILLISDGGVTESGTHDELMERNGAYAAMFRLQARRFVDDPFALVEEDAR